ncbi:hypothetical protein DERF_007266 [Dermatophagoides farinae]|uniref:Uncharacterized protein n=1 Tax=Dermatophagoides farinae TaxID=6954 RepID=A0A922HXT9_DERFA|nr:hypothetical protein DERF_007266 [Dermatophagoides farinae]
MKKSRRSIKRKSISVDRPLQDEMVKIDDSDSSSQDDNDVDDNELSFTGVGTTKNASSFHLDKQIKRIENKQTSNPILNRLNECLKRIRFSNIRLIQGEMTIKNSTIKMKLKVIKDVIKEFEQFLIETEVIWPLDDHRNLECLPCDKEKNIILNYGEKILLVYGQQLPYPESMFKSGTIIELYPDWFVHRFNNGRQSVSSSSSSSEIKYFILSAFNVLIVDD